MWFRALLNGVLSKRKKGHVIAMRIVRVKFAALVGTVFLVVLFFNVWLFPWTHSPTVEEIQKEDEAVELACRHPDLDINNPLITKHIFDMGELQCKRELDWLSVENGKIVINDIILKRHGRIVCSITYLTRIDDFTSKKEQIVEFTSDVGFTRLEQDFFQAECNSADKLTWNNIMAGVARNETIVKKKSLLKPPEDSMKLNILIFGLDSLSRLHYTRKLPKTYKYLTEVLNATVLKGYNIVGDGTPQALIPILTSSTEPELPETRKRMKSANFVNIYPFAWKNFSANGYVTAFGEDCPYTGIFTYRLKGFNEMPTDHYMRTFYVEVDKELKNHPKLCLGNKPRHQAMLQWLYQFYKVYSDIPKFAFCFHGELSHDDYNLVGYADTDLQNFLKSLHEEGILNNTLLMLMSDHGHRFASIRETQQGKQEERLPFFAIAVPSWLESKYPAAVQNLRTNGNRLTTPFDIYATLLTVLNPKVPKVGDVSSRSISLFSEVPIERTCTNAGIEPHWCACLSWAWVPLDDPIAKKASQAVIDLINELTEQQRQLCAKLILDKVTRAEKLQPNKALLKFKKNADKDGFVGDFTDNTQISDIIYQIQFYTFPNHGIYEASVKYNILKETFQVREEEISRINMYGAQPHCIQDMYPNLRKYCYCKIQL